jgi:hypothetical protein
MITEVILSVWAKQHGVISFLVRQFFLDNGKKKRAPELLRCTRESSRLGVYSH